MISLLVITIYLSFIYDFVLAPIPSEASTHNLVTKPERVDPGRRVVLTLAHTGLLVLWVYPLLVAVMAVSLSASNFGNAQSSPVAWVGVLLAAAGRGITITASLQLQRRGTHSVVDSGIFRCSRHPIVVGLHLTLFGLILSSGCHACLLAYPLTLLYFDQKIRIEESALLQRFGKSYTDYAEVTPRYLPYIGQISGKPYGN